MPSSVPKSSLLEDFTMAQAVQALQEEGSSRFKPKGWLAQAACKLLEQRMLLSYNILAYTHR